jgi:hypothetical protein
MAENERSQDERADALWRRLAGAARLDSPSTTCPPGFAQRVIAQLPDRRLVVVVRERQRLVSVAACLALAASLLVCVWSWRDLEAAWSPPPEILAPVVDVEPLS